MLTTAGVDCLLDRTGRRHEPSCSCRGGERARIRPVPALPGSRDTHRHRRGRAAARGEPRIADRLRAGRRPGLRRARPSVASQRDHPGHRAGQGRRRQGPLRRLVPDLQAGRHEPGERPDVARRAQPRPRLSVRGPGARLRRRRSGQRLAGRQQRCDCRAADGEPRWHAVPAGAGRPRPRWRAGARARPRPHRQSLRPGIAAAAGADQSGAVPAVQPRHEAGQAGLARRREPARRGDRRSRRRALGLGLGALRRGASLSRHARPHPGLPEERLRCGSALPGGLRCRRSLRARHRLRGVARCRRVLQDGAGRRCRHAEPARAQHEVQHRARRLAVGQLPARLAAPRLQPERRRKPGARRHVADHRRPTHRAQPALGPARRRARAVSARQRRAAVVAAA